MTFLAGILSDLEHGRGPQGGIYKRRQVNAGQKQRKTLNKTSNDGILLLVRCLGRKMYTPLSLATLPPWHRLLLNKANQSLWTNVLSKK